MQGRDWYLACHIIGNSSLPPDGAAAAAASNYISLRCSGGEFGADQTKNKYVISFILRNLTCYAFKPAYARGCEQHVARLSIAEIVYNIMINLLFFRQIET